VKKTPAWCLTDHLCHFWYADITPAACVALSDIPAAPLPPACQHLRGAAARPFATPLEDYLLPVLFTCVCAPAAGSIECGGRQTLWTFTLACPCSQHIPTQRGSRTIKHNAIVHFCLWWQAGAIRHYDMLSRASPARHLSPNWRGRSAPSAEYHYVPHADCCPPFALLPPPWQRTGSWRRMNWKEERPVGTGDISGNGEHTGMP